MGPNGIEKCKMKQLDQMGLCTENKKHIPSRIYIYSANNG